MVLDIELEEFARMKDQLIASCEGKFVLIHGTDLIGTFETAEIAYNVGVQALGLTPFLIKKISATEQVFVNHALAHGLINARI